MHYSDQSVSKEWKTKLNHLWSTNIFVHYQPERREKLTRLHQKISNCKRSLWIVYWGTNQGSKVLLENQGYTEFANNNIKHEKNNLLEAQRFEKYLAFVYLHYADQAKYGSIMSGLITQQWLGNDQYPKPLKKPTLF